MQCPLVSVVIGAAVLIGTSGIATSASAQPDSGTMFFAVGALANIERTSQSSSFVNDASDLDGTVPGGALGLGVYLTPALSARVEWSMTSWLEYDTEPWVYPLAAGPGLAPSRIVGPPFEGKRMSKAGFALLGYRVGSRQSAVELLGGIGWVALSTRSAYDFRIALPAGTSIGLPYPYSESRSTLYSAAAVAGIDATVALTDHAAIVPQFRAYASNGILSMRPGLSFRWTF